jgi:phage FluMu protein Com
MRPISKSLQERLNRIRSVLPRSYVDAKDVPHPAEWSAAVRPSPAVHQPRDPVEFAVQRADESSDEREWDLPWESVAIISAPEPRPVVAPAAVLAQAQAVMFVRCSSCRRRAMTPFQSYVAAIGTTFECPRCGTVNTLSEVVS